MIFFIVLIAESRLGFGLAASSFKKVDIKEMLVYNTKHVVDFKVSHIFRFLTSGAIF